MNNYYVGMFWGKGKDGLWASLMMDAEEVDTAVYDSPEKVKAEWKKHESLGFDFKVVELSY